MVKLASHTFTIITQTEKKKLTEKELKKKKWKIVTKRDITELVLLLYFFSSRTILIVCD